MHRSGLFSVTAVLVLALAACESTSAPPTLSDRPSERPGSEGLFYVDNPSVDLALARPDVNWASYRQIIIQDLAIPDDVLDATPSTRGRSSPGESWVIPRADGDRLAAEFREQVTREFRNGGEIAVVNTPGPGTLVLVTQVKDITLTAPVESSRRSSTQTFTENAGSMTIAGALTDSQTGEVLAQFADASWPSNPMWQVNNRTRNFADARRLFRQWAVQLRGALIKAKAGSVEMATAESG